MPIIDMAARNPRRCFQVRRTFRLVVIVIVEVAMIRDEVDGWMDARQVLPFVFLTCF